MQVTLIAPSSRQFSIESTNPEVILLWMTEYVPQISGEWRMRIWFSNESEARMFGTPYMTDEQMTRQGFLKIANLFQRAEREPTESKKEIDE